MPLLGDPDPQGFSAVGIDAEPPWEVKECIDYASPAKSSLVLFAYLSFLGYYAFLGFTGPPRLSTAAETVPLHFQSPKTTNVTIDMRLVNLNSDLRFFDLNCEAVRNWSDSVDSAVQMNFSEIHRLKKGGSLSAISPVRFESGEFMFPAGSNVSTPVRVLPIEVDDHEAVILSVTVESAEIRRMNLTFSYPYVNPSYEGYFSMMRYFFSGTVLYGLVMYIMSWEEILHQDTTCVMLGFLGLVSCNPTSYWLQNYPRATAVVDAGLIAAFFNYFRFFVFERIREIVNEKPSIAVEVFFFALGFGDFWSGVGKDWALERAAAGSNSLPLDPGPLFQTVLFVVYAFLIGNQCRQVCCRRDELPHEATRTFCFGTVQLVAFLMTAVQIGGWWLPRIGADGGPKLSVFAAHFGGATACLLWRKEFQDAENDREVDLQFALDESES
jgi:hypothetical protein